MKPQKKRITRNTLVALIIVIGGFLAFTAGTIENVSYLNGLFFELTHKGIESTPQLKLEFWQDGKRVFMTDDSGLKGTKSSKEVQPIIEAKLKSAPFEIHFPRLVNKPSCWKGCPPAIMICTSDESLPNVQIGYKDTTGSDVNCFNAGTGIPDTEYPSGILFLRAFDGVGHNFFSDDRIIHLSSSVDKIYITRVGYTSQDAELQGLPTGGMSLTEWKKDLYLTVWINKNRNDTIDDGEFEYILLHFLQ